MYQRIEKKIIKKIVFKILQLLFLAAAIVALLFISFPYCDRAERTFSVLVSIAIYIFLFFKIKLIPLLRDKEWTGTVESRACKRQMTVRGAVARYGNIVEVMMGYWKIQRDDGESEILTYETEDVADDYFHTGDRVLHYKGAKYIVLAEPEADNENLLCPLCGKLVMKPECSFCKIDFDTSRRQTTKNS
ncbi:MAG: hypothetical protein IJW90_06240 [Clostridia bacterium]|nr:hypothetical protein [Clostridia bacterium]